MSDLWFLVISVPIAALLWRGLEALLAQKATGPEVHELLMRLMQMNPYSAYGKGKAVSKSRIKGKGERKDDPFDEAFDTKARFNQPEGYEEFKDMRKRLYAEEEDEHSPKRQRRPAPGSEDDDE